MKTQCLKEIGIKLWERKRLLYQTLQNSEIANESSKVAEHLLSKNPRQILWHIINNVGDIPQCKICEKPAVWHIDKKEYRLFCGRSCAAKATAIDYSKKCMEKFGVTHHSKIIGWNDKVKETCQEKYGVNHPSQVESIKQTRKQTCIDKYGGPAPSSSYEVRQKMAETSLKKYGEKESC